MLYAPHLHKPERQPEETREAYIERRKLSKVVAASIRVGTGRATDWPTKKPKLGKAMRKSMKRDKQKDSSAHKAFAASLS